MDNEKKCWINLASENEPKSAEPLKESKAHTMETEEKAGNLRSTYNADRRVLQDKINDLERKLTLRMGDIQSLQHLDTFISGVAD